MQGRRGEISTRWLAALTLFMLFMTLTLIWLLAAPRAAEKTYEGAALVSAPYGIEAARRANI